MFSLDSDSILVKETASILQEGLDEYLSNRQDLIANKPSNDLYNTIVTKVDFIKDRFDLDQDQIDDATNVEAAANTLIVNQFCQDFGVDKKAISDQFNEAPQARFLVNLIYNTFYIGFRENLLTYLISFAYNNKKTLAPEFKQSTPRKDLVYQNIKTELNLDNPEYIILIVNALDIANTVLGAENVDIGTFFDYIDLTSEEREALDELFDSESCESYQTLMSNVLSSEHFPDFLIAFKHRLIDTIKQIVAAPTA
jgi:hypothetical protein